jgi:succinate dehydrogenase / fumarate reductase membrane anchor subunit
MKKAASGVHHWWAQRLTAIALVPLSLWFVAGLVAHAGADRASLIAWLKDPVPAVLMILTLVACLYHAMLGLQEVVVDYVHGAACRSASLIVLKLSGAALIVASIFAVLRIAFVG